MGYNSDVLNRIDGALAYLVGGNREYFRGGDFGSIQGVVQCVQDLSLSDCQDCLQEASGRLRSECETSTWGDMYLGKCYIRYVDEGNGNHPNNDTSHKRNKRRKRRIKWKGAVHWGITVLSFLSSIGGTCYSNNKANKAKKKQNQPTERQTEQKTRQKKLKKRQNKLKIR
ncbi:hypothetical protein L1987_79310 [Smallanthus sonchifolius]|uniref:Uncharacterized protein n=1 Tax=Smallanthus sonchifolius TaxID=185202 RepID=A0ACB8ZFB4_9ASTR|nr:hypothetical protein L1987_79310 [Smallanthus sonchifolius]